MSKDILSLLVLLIITAGIVAVAYLDHRLPDPDVNHDGELRETMQQILANTERLERSLNAQRRVLNDAHKQISAVTKGVENGDQ